MFSTALLVLVLSVPSFGQPAPAGPQNEDPAAQKERLRELVGFLKSMSDEDYKETLAQLPEKAEIPAELASRRAVLSSAYTNLAALEYSHAAQGATQETGARYSQAYQRASRAGDLTVGSGERTEAGLGFVALIALKFLGNAAMNYWLKGGHDFVGEGAGRVGVLERSRQGLETQLTGAAITGKKQAEIHYKMGEVYEQLASASIEPEPAEAPSGKKKERLKALADILRSISDEDYQTTLKELPAKTAGRSELSSRGKVLKSAYVTLAALEYRAGGVGAAGDYQRVSRDEAKNLAIHPESLHEAGWFTNLLGLAAAGGIGYAIYDNQRRHGRRSDPPVYQAPAADRVGTSGKGLPLEAIPGTLALWHFDEGSGASLTDSAGANTGVVVNAPEWVPGIVGGALRFNGLNQYVRAKAGLILGQASAFTVEAWVKYEGENALHPDQFVYGEGSYNDLVVLGLKKGAPDFTVLSSNWKTATAPEPLSAGQWHHLAEVLDAGVGKLYVDGKLTATNINMGPAIQSGVETDIGRFAGNGGSRYFRGAIDELRVLSVPRSAAEIFADYQRGLKGVVEPLHGPLPLEAGPGTVALWHFDEGSGAKLRDSAGSNHGALLGAPQWAAGKVGGALEFNAQSNVRVPADPALNLEDLTIELWMYPTFSALPLTGSKDPQIALVSKRTQNAPQPYNFNIQTDGKLGLMWWDSASTWTGISSPPIVKLNQWQHVAVTRTTTAGAATVSFYFNGALVSSSKQSVRGAAQANDQDLLLGNDGYWGTFNGGANLASQGPFSGRMDEVRILSGARSSAQILADYQRGLGAMTAGGTTNVSAQFGGLHESLTDLDGQLAGGKLDPAQAAEVHHKLGSVYEQLASAAIAPAARPQPRVPQPRHDFPAKEAPAAASDALTPKEIYQRAGPAVVLLTCTNRDGNGELGTGSVINAQGHILTNAHVALGHGAQPFETISVYFKPRRVTGDPQQDLAKPYAGKVLAYDRDLDLAVVELEEKPAPLTVLPLGDAEAVDMGDPVVAIGHPEKGGFWTLTSGVVSTVKADLDDVKGKDVFQTDASINRGNSGGPLISRQGALIGVNTSMARKAQDGLAITSVNFSVKASVVKNWLTDVGVRFQEAAAPSAPGKTPPILDEAAPAQPAPAAPLKPEMLTPKKPFSIEDILKRDMEEMEDLEKEMRQKIENRRPRLESGVP